MFFCWWAAFSGTTDHAVWGSWKNTLVTRHQIDERSELVGPGTAFLPARDTTRPGLRSRDRESGTSFVAFDRDKESEGVSSNNKEKKGVFWKPDIKAIGRQLVGCS